VTSRERMLAAISGGELDYVPCSFMIFAAVRAQSRDDLDAVSRQLAMGLDPVVELATWGAGAGPDNADLPGPPLRSDAEVRSEEWVAEEEDLGPVIHRRYDTPEGPLTVAVRWTRDWRRGAHVPLFDDWVIPRATKFLVETEEDLEALPHLLAPPNDDDRARLREAAAPKLAFAKEHGLLVAGGLGVGLEAGHWLCGMENLMWAALDRPEWVDRLVEIVHRWNASRMEAMLALGVDLFIRRAWYEGVDFFSPGQFRRFVVPTLAREAELAHAAGARFGYINTSGTAPLLDAIMDAGVDVLIGVDPVQGRGTDLREMRRITAGRMCLWGGVNGFITVERGNEDEVRAAVAEAMEALGPERFILSPVDNVTGDSEQVWRNVEALTGEWRRGR
jgi:hypothetical protein